MTTRLLYLASHPIQYQAPLLRLLSTRSGLSLRVLFERIPPQTGSFDEGFGRQVAWDVPLLEGYESALLQPRQLASEIAAADVVWLHGWQNALFRKALGLASRLGKPVLMRGENWGGAMPDGSGLRRIIKRYYLHRILKRCTGFLAIGSANREYYLDHSVAPERVFMAPYAVDNDFFTGRAAAVRPRRSEIRRALGLDPTRPVILFSGKFQPRKRPDLVIGAAALMAARPQVLFVGDGDMSAELRRTAAGAVFAGFRNQTELPEIYAAADLFVLPSEREPWGLAVNEAMACGTPVVVSDQVGCHFDLVDETTGAVFPAGDVRALATAMSRVLEASPAAGAAALARVGSWNLGATVAGIEAALEWARRGHP